MRAIPHLLMIITIMIGGNHAWAKPDIKCLQNQLEKSPTQSPYDQRVFSFLQESVYSTSKNYSRTERAFDIRQGGKPVKPISEFPVYVEKRNGKISRIFQLDPTHPNEVEVFDGKSGKHLGVTDYSGNFKQKHAGGVIGRNFWQNPP